MRLVELTEEVGHVRICIEWMPHFFVACDPTLARDMTTELNRAFVGQTMDAKLLDAIHEHLCKWLEARFTRYPGLASWLNHLRDVEDIGENREPPVGVGA